jgi:hypothetical protein
VDFKIFFAKLMSIVVIFIFGCTFFWLVVFKQQLLWHFDAVLGSGRRFHYVRYFAQVTLLTFDMKSIAFITLMIVSQACTADDASIIKKSLTADTKMEGRLADGDTVVSLLSRSGLFSKKPAERQDYSFFYIPRKPIYVLGAKLISFEHEYLTEYIGCCVNAGNAVILKPSGSISAIEAFAIKNKCRLSVGGQIFLVPKSAAKSLSNEDRKNLVEVSCKDNYLFE